MVIGVDFDNTIVCYNQIFQRVALARGLIPAKVPTTKDQVRNYLRQCGREDDWIEMQGYVYGVCIRDAPPFPGVLEFFIHCQKRGVMTYIISHKTRYPFQGPRYDLHLAAHEWLKSHGFYDTAKIGLSPNKVYFELTKQEKLKRIASVGCSHFVDDLAEFLAESRFPGGVERILFDPYDHHAKRSGFWTATSWEEIDQLIIDRQKLT